MRLFRILLMVFIMTTSASAETKTQSAIFAGGCFWCMQPVFDSFEGVKSTTVGYSGGHTVNPTYDELNTHTTGHYEVIKVDYDPSIVKYEELVKVYFANIDPFDSQGQFADKGQQYEPVIFYATPEQKTTADKVEKEVADKFIGRRIAVKVLPAKEFYAAEDYHQEYYKKNPMRYEMYKVGSGRAAGVKKIWGDKK